VRSQGSNQYQIRRAPALASPVPAVPLTVPGSLWELNRMRQEAAAPDTSPQRLAELARMPAVRDEAARNPHTPPATLAQLSADERPKMRWIVAGNLNTPPAVLERLLEDTYFEVRGEAARNPSLPYRAVERLLRSPDRLAAEAAADNPAVSAATRALWQLGRDF